jgi:hypothetical protein
MQPFLDEQIGGAPHITPDREPVGEPRPMPPLASAGVPLAEAVKSQILVMFGQKNRTPQALSA